MKIIGLCGQSGAGKTTALEVFSRHGFGVIDCDLVSREVMSAGSGCLVELAGHFGEEILSNNGTLKRQALADIAFSSPEHLQALNAITHKYILREVFARLDAFGKEGVRVAVVDAPVLFESGLDKSCDTTLAICADSEKRVERIVARDGIDPERARARIERQLSEKELSELCDRVIYNNSTIEDLESAVEAYAQEIGDSLEKT